MCINISIENSNQYVPVVSARGMEWYGKRLNTVLNFVPRGQTFPENKFPDEMKWSNRYAFVGMKHTVLLGSLGFCTGYSDGLNEEGLSAASLSFGDSTYQSAVEGKDILYSLSVVNYILGNCDSVEKAENALHNITVCEIPYNGDRNLTNFHFIISDSHGDNLIIEYIDGIRKTYKNTKSRGNMANEPTYDWHLINMKENYYELTIERQMGIPGDQGSISRFVRASLLTQKTTFKPQNIQQCIGFAQDILLTLAIPAGTDPRDVEGEEKYKWSQWSVIRDHTNRILYFYTDFNNKLHGVSLNQLDLDAKEQKSINIEMPDWYENVSHLFS